MQVGGNYRAQRALERYSGRHRNACATADGERLWHNLRIRQSERVGGCRLPGSARAALHTCDALNLVDSLEIQLEERADQQCADLTNIHEG